MENDIESLKTRVNGYLDKPSLLDSSHIEEGVCLRIEHDKMEIFKQKSFSFCVLEGIIKEDQNYIDTEEAS